MKSAIAALAAAFLLPACAVPHRAAPAAPAVSCDARATQIIASNVDAIANHRYAAASRAAEQAGRVSLRCAATAPSSQRFDRRWRGANALIVAAELAHEGHDTARAHRLLAEGLRIMHDLRVPRHVSEVTSTLIAQRLAGARGDLAGQWAYW